MRHLGLRLAAFAMFAAYYNYVWWTRKPGKSGQKRPTAAMMAKLAVQLPSQQASHSIGPDAYLRS
jgi:hypothetical protein